MNRPWLVKQDRDWFKYARHNRYEQRREAEYQFSETIDHPAETVTVPHEEYHYQLNLSAHGGPSVTVDYRKTEEIAWDDSAEFDIEQTSVMYWNGRSWGPNPTWVLQSTRPHGADPDNIKKRTVSDGEQEVKSVWTETLYATADGGTTHNKDKAGWLTKAPEGEGWTQIGQPGYAEWSDDDPWVQVVGYEWTTGKDPGPHPDHYDGYNAECQRFRPVVKKWKVRLEAPPAVIETPPEAVTPPETEDLVAQPIVQEEVPDLEPARFPAENKPGQAARAHKVDRSGQDRRGSVMKRLVPADLVGAALAVALRLRPRLPRHRRPRQPPVHTADPAAVLAVRTGGGTLDAPEHVKVGKIANVSCVEYEVTRVIVVTKAQLAERAERLFDHTGTPKLALVTCEGFNHATRTYSENVVVIARSVL